MERPKFFLGDDDEVWFDNLVQRLDDSEEKSLDLAQLINTLCYLNEDDISDQMQHNMTGALFFTNFYSLTGGLKMPTTNHELDDAALSMMRNLSNYKKIGAVEIDGNIVPMEEKFPDLEIGHVALAHRRQITLIDTVFGKEHVSREVKELSEKARKSSFTLYIIANHAAAMEEKRIELERRKRGIL